MLRIMLKGTLMKIYIAAVFAAAAVFVQALPPPQGGRPERGGEMFLQRALNDRDLMRSLGVADETVAKIDEANKAVNDRLRAAKTRIDDLSAKQVELAGAIFSTPGADPKPLMDVIDEIGRLRIVTAQEMTRRMLILRDTLTREQMKALKERLDEQRKLRREQFLKESERGSRRAKEEPREKPAAAPQPSRPGSSASEP